MTYTNGDILGRGKEPVDKRAHEGRIEAVLYWQLSKLGVGHALRNHDRADSDTCTMVSM